MWGTLQIFFDGRELKRFIPTRVGNTEGECKVEHFKAVHPHACGEHPLWTGEATATDGSSPRVWGTLVVILWMLWAARFIPTRVGNTVIPYATTHYITVHPHACGEHCAAFYAQTLTIGSSPRVWGTLYQHNSRNKKQRFIPTRVGNTAFRLTKA